MAASASLTTLQLLLIAPAAVLAGAVNAVAGGGSLISFPALTAVGLPPLMANVTNTLALLPGYGGATLAQRQELNSQGRRLLGFVPAAALGGLLGALLLLRSGERLFADLVPWLILLGTGLLALQSPLRRWLLSRPVGPSPRQLELAAAGPVFLAAIYGGYFGAGLGVILLAVLAVLLPDTLNRLNGLKQALALVINLAAAMLLARSGQVHVGAAVVMAAGSVVGGGLGGRLARRLNPERLRSAVVGLGLLLAMVFFLRR